MNKWYMHNSAVVLKMTHTNSFRTLTYKRGSPNLDQKISPNNNQQKKKKKKICKTVDFADHKIKTERK